MSNKTRGTHFKRLLLSFLVLYTAYSQIPTAVTQSGRWATQMPLPRQTGRPPLRNRNPTPGLRKIPPLRKTVHLHF